MRNLSIVLGGLLAVSAIVSVNLWRELRAERVLNAELSIELEGSRAAELSARRASAAGIPPAAAPVPFTAAGPPDPVPQDKPAVVADPAPPPPPPLPVFAIDQQEMMKDPDYRAARIAQMRSTIAQSYPGLVEELGLNQQDASRLFDVLAELQLESSNNTVAILQGSNGMPDAAATQRMMDANRGNQRRQEEAVSAALGPARYAQWQEYQQNRASYMQASQLSRTMEGAGQPALSSSQNRMMREVYVAEQKRQRDDMAALNRSLMANGGPAADPGRFMEEQHKVQEARNTRIVEAASRHLSASQTEALRNSLEQQLAITRVQSRVMRERMATQPAPGR